MRRAARRDRNEPEIVAVLLAAGATVQRLDPPSPDLLVGFRGTTFLLEVKDDVEKPRNDRERRYGGLTPSQIEWNAKWRGSTVRIVKTLNEALEAIEARRA